MTLFPPRLPSLLLKTRPFFPFLAATRPSTLSPNTHGTPRLLLDLLCTFGTSLSSLTLRQRERGNLRFFVFNFDVFLNEQTSADALFCSQSCRSKDASFSSRPRPLLPPSASTSTTSSSSSTAARLANNRPQLTIAMPLSFAPSSRLGPHSATTPSPSVPLPTKEQLAARSRRYTAPSSRHPLLHSQPQPCAISSNGAGAGFPSSPAPRPHAPAHASAGGAALASPFPSHPIVLPQGYQTSPRASQHHRIGVEAVNGNDDDETRGLLSSQTIASATGNGKRYVSSAPNVSILPFPQQLLSIMLWSLES